MTATESISLEEFLSFFPLVDLPIALSDDIIFEISKTNKILPVIALTTFVAKWEKELDDETEIMACCQLAPQDDFYSLVYWKAGLMSYEFILVTIDKVEGNLIQKKVIAGVISNGSTIKQSTAKIEDDLSIQIMVGEKKVSDQHYDPSNSYSYHVEVLPDGQMMSSQDNEKLWQEQNSNQEN